jgi:hypothetical protein
MLRSFGVQLSLHATWIAFLATACICALSLRPCRRTTPYIISSYTLTSICGVAWASCFALLEWLRGSHVDASAAALQTVAVVWLGAPFALGIAVAAAARTWTALVFVVVTGSLAMTMLGQFAAAVWSGRQVVASIVVFASMAVLANVYCRAKI